MRKTVDSVCNMEGDNVSPEVGTDTVKQRHFPKVICDRDGNNVMKDSVECPIISA